MTSKFLIKLNSVDSGAFDWVRKGKKTSGFLGEENLRCVQFERLFSRWRCSLRSWKHGTRIQQKWVTGSHCCSVSWSQVSRGDSQGEQKKYKLLYESEDPELMRTTYLLCLCIGCCKCHGALSWLSWALVASECPHTAAPTTSPQHSPFQYTAPVVLPVSPHQGRLEAAGSSPQPWRMNTKR